MISVVIGDNFVSGSIHTMRIWCALLLWNIREHRDKCFIDHKKHCILRKDNCFCEMMCQSYINDLRY